MQRSLLIAFKWFWYSFGFDLRIAARAQQFSCHIPFCVALNGKILIRFCAMELQISMIPSPEDPPWRSDDYQSGLRNLGLTLRADGLEIPISGEWRVKLSATLGPILGVPVGSWLQARRGRTVRLTIGEVEADVRTADELVNAIKIAKFYQEAVENES